jgi:UDP-glucose 4-epimerase
MKILVTGGAGYIGSHTVKALRKEGFEVVIFDNFSSGKQQLVLGGTVIHADLSDKNALAEVFQEHDFFGVMHFASLIQVGESYLDPQKYFQGNLVTTLNLLEAMLDAGVKDFIFSSSAAVYGIPAEIPIPESHPLDPYNPYGQSKYFVEKILSEYARAYGLRFYSLRYFNAAGADPEGQLGEMHDPETHLIPNLLLSLLKPHKVFQLYGTDFPTADGTAIRDYIHVTDLASAHVLALQSLQSGAESGHINLGANRGYSVKEVIQQVERITGKAINYQTTPRREGDVPELLASNQLARQKLKWQPQYSDLETIIQTAWDWHSRS